MNKTTQLIEVIFSFLRCMKEQMSSQSEAMNLSMIHLHKLIFINQNPATHMKAVAEYLKVELPSATSIINKLVKLSYVIRQTDAEDRRLVLLNLTAKGEGLLSEAMEARAKNMKKILTYLSEKDQNELFRIFGTLIKAMEEKNEK